MDKLKSVFSDITNLISTENLWHFLTGLCVVVIIRIALKVLRHAIIIYQKNKSSTLIDVGIIGKVFGYINKGVFLFFILWLFGIDLKTIFGAAGIFGIAVTLAAQTSFSNIISGIFVVADRSFSTGDWITVDEITGCVQEVTFMSTKVLTGDNQLVRIPNETIFNTKVINITCVDKRRFKFELAVSPGRDLNEVRKKLLAIAGDCPLVLKDPEPGVFIDNYINGVFNVVLTAWSKTDDFFAMRTEVFIKLSAAADEMGLSFPHNGIKVDR